MIKLKYAIDGTEFEKTISGILKAKMFIKSLKLSKRIKVRIFNEYGACMAIQNW